MFRGGAVLAFRFYSINFLLDLFYNIESYLYMIDDDNERTRHGQQGSYTILFLCSITFIIVPSLCTLLRLHKKLSKWLIDPILSRTEALIWIK